MTNEEFLVDCINQCIKQLDDNIRFISELSEDVIIPGFDDGKICAYTRTLSLIRTMMGLYEANKDKENG
jgi:hypothetical protein